MTTQDTIPCLSLWQPHASLWARGSKIHETRSWATKIRGDVAVHAAKKWDKELSAIAWREPFKTHFWFDIASPPLGCLIGVVNIVDCVEITADNAPSSPDFDFGNYEPGRFMFRAENPRRLDKPIPWNGFQRWGRVPVSIFPPGVLSR